MRVVTYTEYEVRSTDDFHGLVANTEGHDLKKLEDELRRAQKDCEYKGYRFGELFIVEQSGIKVYDDAGRFVTETTTRRTVGEYIDGRICRL